MEAQLLQVLRCSLPAWALRSAEFSHGNHLTFSWCAITVEPIPLRKHSAWKAPTSELTLAAKQAIQAQWDMSPLRHPCTHAFRACLWVLGTTDKPCIHHPFGKAFSPVKLQQIQETNLPALTPPLHSDDSVPSGRAPQLLLSRGLSIVSCRSNMDLLGPKEVAEIKPSCVFHRLYCCEVFTAERTIRHSSQKENTQIPTASLL